MHKSLSFFVLALVGLTAAPAAAGPPLICHAVAIGDARSLPWNDGAGWNGMVASYDTARLVGDTLAIVAPQTPVPVRMETLRRAAIYASRDPRRADELAERFYQAKAWFELGFFIEAVREAGEAYAMIHEPSERAAWQLRTPPPYVAALLAERK